MSAIGTRTATEEDAEPIAAILAELGWFQRFADGVTAEAIEGVRRHIALCRADTSHTVLVAEVGGTVMGYAAAHWVPYLLLPGPEGYVSELFVAGRARGRGIGGTLLQSLAMEARERGCSRLLLSNNRARESYRRGFYRKQGWEERPGIANFVYPL